MDGTVFQATHGASVEKLSLPPPDALIRISDWRIQTRSYISAKHGRTTLRRRHMYGWQS